MTEAEPDVAAGAGSLAGQPDRDLSEELVERFTGDETDAPLQDGEPGYNEGDAPALEYSRYDRWFTKFSRWCSYLAAVSLLIVTIVAFADVIGAKFFGKSIPGQFDLIANLNLVMVFLAVFYVQMDRGSVAIELLQDHFARWAKLATRLFGSFLGAASSFFCAYRGWYYVADFYSSQKAATGLWKFPIWPFEAILVLGFFFLGVAFLFTFAREITDVRLERGRYARPLPKDTVPVAAEARPER